MVILCNPVFIIPLAWPHSSLCTSAAYCEIRHGQQFFLDGGIRTKVGTCSSYETFGYEWSSYAILSFIIASAWPHASLCTSAADCARRHGYGGELWPRLDTNSTEMWPRLDKQHKQHKQHLIEYNWMFLFVKRIL
jgi:hypothetical protein